MDFDDLLLETLSRWEGGRTDARFTHLLVDEFQDIDPLQYRLIAAWRRDGGSLFVIGDPYQSIYSFRGADAACFDRLRSDCPQTRTITLTRNYRSTPEILSCALQVVEENGGAGLQAGPVSGSFECNARHRAAVCAGARRERRDRRGSRSYRMVMSSSPALTLPPSLMST